MTDIEFGNSAEFGDRLDVSVIQAMPGIDDQPQRLAVLHRLRDTSQFALLPVAFGISIAAGMQFNHRCATGQSGFELLRLRIDEQADPDVGRCETLTGRLNPFYG